MFPKGGMGKLMKQAQEMQDKMAKAQRELIDIEADGQAGGGMVSAIVNGNKEIISVSINDEVINDEKEILEDLVVAAINQALKNVNIKVEEKMSSVTGGMLGNMKLPGM